MRVQANAVGERLSRLDRAYPPLAGIDDPHWPDMVARARPLHMPPGMDVLSPGMRSQGLIMLLEGTLRVYQMGQDGREITLYRVAPGDICVMSLTSLIHQHPFGACVQTDTEVDALVLGAADFRIALAESAAFRDWVLSALTTSFREVLDTFHDAVFDPLSLRLACLLGRLFERSETDCLQITHQQLAQELGSTREVVSRHLKDFERHGCILLSRGCIRMAPGQHLPLDIG